MTEWIANARMYAVTPEVEAAWRALLEHVAHAAQVRLTYLPYPAPQPLERLWARADLGAVFMCGYPLALKMAPVIALAAPVPRVAWAQGRAVYRSDLIVRSDSAYRRLEDTFGGRAGWTVSHSQSGFNAFRHELLAHRTPARPALYAQHGRQPRHGAQHPRWRARGSSGHRAAGCLLAPADPAPRPGTDRGDPRARFDAAHAYAAAGDRRGRPGGDGAAACVQALTQAHQQDWFAALAEPLLLEGFEPVTEAAFAPLLEWDREATASGYAVPA